MKKVDLMGFAPSVFAYISYRLTGFPKTLPMNITLSVTDRCNSRCKTCNIWKYYRKNPGRIKDELTLDEYESIFSRLGNLFWVTITGGEPFMRADLKDIISSLYNKNRPVFLTIATNGLMTEKIIKDVRYISGKCPNMKIFINFSIDGIGKKNDAIRGVGGAFKKSTETIHRLKIVQKRHRNIFIGVNTVISRYNVKDIEEIYDYVDKNILPDSHIFELAEKRAKLYNTSMRLEPESDAYSNALKFLISKIDSKPVFGLEKTLLKKLRVSYYTSLLRGNLPKSYEGIASAYIMPSGELWLSYAKGQVLGNLRDHGYDLGMLLFSGKAEELRKSMDSGYKTTLVNAYYVNMMCDPVFSAKTLLSNVFK